MVTYSIPYEGTTTRFFQTLEEAESFSELRLEDDCMAEIKDLRIFKVEEVKRY